MRPFALLVVLWTSAAAAQVDIRSTKHNLSASGPGSVKAQSESQICIFCHVPHRGLTRGLNRPPSSATYTPYASTTLVSRAPGAPSGSSRICLSCHDGTIALGQTVASGLIQVVGTGPGGTMPVGPTNLGTDLRKTHPISFAPAPAPQLRTPPPGDPVKLDRDGLLQCTSCHDPHQDGLDPAQRDFLVKPNRASALCLTCHLQPYWATNPSSHETSLKRFDTSLGAHTAYTTVADNGCESCHRPHGAVSTGGRLLNDSVSSTCLVCHAGQVATPNVGAQLQKPYVHPVLTGNPALHDESEGPTSAAFRLPESSASAPRHVQCVDCHNPHAAFAQPAAAPRVNGFLSGVWGIDRSGARASPAQNEYEVCFKCHADSANQPQRLGPTPPETVRRAITDVNLRRVFDLSAPSFHPVEGPGPGTDVPSLVPPWTAASIVRCGDCHASDAGPGTGGSEPAGPHGSIYPHLLERNLTTADRTAESPAAYALCYKCHSRSSILSDTTFLHRLHVQEERAPCSACHDWHGVSALQGNATNNAHLINFDTSIVRPSSSGLLSYTRTGFRSGNCTLTCHGENHTGFSYGPGRNARPGLP